MLKRLGLTIGIIAVVTGIVGAVRAPHVTSVHAVTGASPVVVIVMENKDYGDVVNAPYLSDFASRGTLFTNYHANTHPSLPNYMAMTSGVLSCNGSDSCATNSFTQNNIFRQLGKARIGWRAYEESMPSNCARSSSGSYLVRHNPPPYYTDLAKTCPKRDLPYPNPVPSPLKPFTFVTPNACNDMHDCSVTTGDNWLAAHVPALLQNNVTVVIVFDEGSTSDGGGGHVYAAVVGPNLSAGHTDSTSYSHYNLLAGLEDHFGVPRLAGAVGKVALPL